MTIPSSVARRARQSAVRGDTNTSAFFYVRQIRDTATNTDSFVVVTCRLAGGGARVPLALTDVRINFIAPKGQRAVFLVAQGAKSPEFEAKIHYNGAGRLKGRWEVIKPGVSSYTAPPWIRDQAGSMRWRVTALNSSGRVVAESSWRSLTILEQSE